MKILLSGYSCSPYRGSEGGMTWNWAWHLSRKHQVWVLTRSTPRAEIERFLADNPNVNLKFIWVDAPNTLTPWVPKGSAGMIRLRYGPWLRKSYNVAAAAHQDIGFDVAHHVSYNVFFPPPQLYRLPIPFVWGPVGGAMTAPRAFLGYFGVHRWIEDLRNLRVGLSGRLPSFKRAVRNTALTLATNHETAEALRRAGATDVSLLLDSVPRRDFLLPAPRPVEAKKELVLMWAGWLNPRKALGLAIEALARVQNLPVRLRVIGEGPMRHPWRKQAEALGIGGRVEFVGKVPWAEMRDQYRRSDAFLFTSLRDSSGNVVFEAMASSLPILALDHQGVGTFVPPEAGVKVPVTTPDETVKGLADGIARLAVDPELRARMGAAGWRFISEQSWDHRAEVMSGYYEKTLRRRAQASGLSSPSHRPLALADE